LKRICITVILSFAWLFSAAQVNVKDSLVAVPLIIPFGGVHAPLGDVQERYKITYHIGAQFLFKHKSNWVWGASGAFLFGENVGERNFMIPIAPIYSADGSMPAISLGMRGMSLMGLGGKLIPLGKKPNRNSGLLVHLGVGYIQHKIAIDVRGDLTPQASGAYVKGYDRLTDGVAISQFVGYMFLGNSRKVNFMVGFEAIQGFTKNRRAYNYDTFQPDTGDKFDVFLGLKVGWMFPIYGKNLGANRQKDKKEREFFYE